MNLSKPLQTAHKLIRENRIRFALSLSSAKFLDLFVAKGQDLRDKILFDAAYHEVHSSGLDFSENLKLRGAYKGNRLFILCTGPSLTSKDVELLKNEYTMAVNGFIHSYGDIHSPKFYAITDGAFYKEGSETFFEKAFNAIGTNTIFFMPHYAQNFMESKIIKKWPQIQPNIYYIPTFSPHNIPTLGHHDGGHFESPDISKQIIKSGNVLLFALLLGLELGFDDIYILGADHDLLSKNPLKNEYWGHCYSQETLPNLSKKTKTYIEKTKYILSVFLHHEKVLNIANLRGQRIYNLTRGNSFLDVYPYIYTDEVLKQTKQTTITPLSS